MTARIMIVVTHLLGAGHLSRALTLGHAFAEAGQDVHIVSGGFPAPQFDTGDLTLHALPPLRANGTDFKNLLGADGIVASVSYRQNRQQALLDLFQQIAPDVMITELFPFGRRNLKDEFTALLQAAHVAGKRPRVYCSIRDIIEPPGKQAKIDYAEDLIARYYDGVLVHSDPRVLTLDQSWPVTERLKNKLIYSGFVAPEMPGSVSADGRNEVLVSTGGSDIGDRVFFAATEAARDDDHQWRLLVGGPDAERRISEIRAQAPDNVIVEAARPDFRAMLGHVAVSVSLCGYNTSMDILQIGPPAVFIPFDGDNEREQSIRAKALSGLPSLEILGFGTLSGSQMLAAVRRVRAGGSRDVSGFRLDGAREAARLCLAALE